MFVEVIKPGLSTTLQDTGRQGYYHLGIPPSGGMDQFSLQAANLLLGNPADAAVLECTLMGPELLFHATRQVATCGAEMVPKVDGIPQANNAVFTVPAGSRLTFDFVRDGARLYLAVAGGFDVPIVLGSRSTYALGSLGGLEGRKLQAGDCLPLGEKFHTVNEGRSLPHACRSVYTRTHTLRVVPGLYDHRVTQEAMERFFSDSWSVASEADRTGYRLKGGSRLEFIERDPPFGAGDDPSNIVDACYPIGSVQVPSGAEPIILHRDAVSGGGYAMIATVISADMDRIGQMQPHHQVRFTPVTLAEAFAARQEYRQRFETLYQRLAI